MTAKPIILGAVIVLIVGAIFYLQTLTPKPPPASEPLTSTASSTVSVSIIPNPAESQASTTNSIMPPASKKTAIAKPLPQFQEIVSPAGFINSQPFALKDLVGKKVVLVDFWTYSCINCQRTIPYLNAWYEKYKDRGLEIVGIHTPEFEFEKKYDNVVRAVEKFGIRYPVVLDNDYGTWFAYGNRYWPRKYLIDINGYIVYGHIGEGAYEETEMKIQEALKERLVALGLADGISVAVVGKPAGAFEVDINQPRTQEIYFGSLRNSALANGNSNQSGPQKLSEPARIETSLLYLAGDWDFQKESAANLSAGAKIIIKYQGKDVYLVGSADAPVKLKVLRDGQPVTAAAGADVQESFVTVEKDQLYKIIEDKTGYGTHTLELIIEKPVLKVFTFTFG